MGTFAEALALPAASTHRRRRRDQIIFDRLQKPPMRSLSEVLRPTVLGPRLGLLGSTFIGRLQIGVKLL